MKVAFIGTHGVGKTTLCFDLAAALKHHGLNVDIVKEVARLSPLPINRQTSTDAQTWILMTQIAEEIRSASRHDVVICDRSVLDNYAYLALACGRHAEIEHFVDYWLRSYELLFKVPVTGRAATDGVRDVDEQFVRAVDDLVDTLLSEKRVVHHRLEPQHRERWAGEVSEIVLADRAMLDRIRTSC
jgi:nicotinamide riboside kinase